MNGGREYLLLEMNNQLKMFIFSKFGSFSKINANIYKFSSVEYILNKWYFILFILFLLNGISFVLKIEHFIFCLFI